MKQFFGSFLGAFFGIFVAFIFSIIIITAIIASSAGGLMADKKPVTVKSKSILHLTFNEPIVERTSKNPFAGFDLSSLGKRPMGLDNILESLAAAKSDNRIKGVFLELGNPSIRMATLEELRNALMDFKSSGKFVLAYSDAYTQAAFYLASVSDKLYMNPEGDMDFRGLSAQVLFFKGLLDKLEIDAQIFRHGKFKSAIEPFSLDRMSPANREQTMSYVGSIWNHMLKGISRERKIEVRELNRIADKLLIRDAESAVKHGLVDELKYKDEVLEILGERTGQPLISRLNLISLNNYSSAKKTRDLIAAKNKIAVVYAVGPIEGGEGDEETIGSDRISKAIRDARLDSSVKAIVLRVNSPGGSALASDVILREAILAKKAKPFVVSMGDVAASGGYYISCAADAIVAQPNTITGSIGVFGLIPNSQRFFSNKLGITVDTVNTNKHADIGSVFRPVDAEESSLIQYSIERVYSTFLGHVARGRKMSVAEVDSIGQGRVWSGEDAKKIGLVDELGGINDAIKLAAKKANLSSYRTISLPKLKDPLEELFGMSVMGSSLLEEEAGIYYEHYQRLKNIIGQKGVHARMLYDLVVY